MPRGLVPGAIAAQLLDELIVDAKDQEGGRPLANEECAMVIAKQFHR